MPDKPKPGFDTTINCQLSFRPLMEALKKNIAEGNPGLQKLYGGVVAELEQYPELMDTITDISIVKKYSELIEELLSAVFPPTTANFMYGVALPFSQEAIYASPLFQQLMLEPGSRSIHLPEETDFQQVDKERVQFACSLILKKYLGFQTKDNFRSVYPYTDPETGLTRYTEFRVDARFIDVNLVNEMPVLPTTIIDSRSNSLITPEELIKQIPLEKFVFEGISVIRMNDVTEQEISAKIRDRLLDINTLSDAAMYTELEGHIRSLIGIKDLTIGVTPFYKINGHYVYSDLHNTNSILFRHMNTSGERDEVSDYCKLLFRDSSQPLIFGKVDAKALDNIQCLRYYYTEGARSLILCPLKYHDGLIGMLEIISKEEGLLKALHVGRINTAIPLFTLGLEKSLERLNSMVDGIIKKKFTSVQPAVEWRFTEAAVNYITHLQYKKEKHIERIVFPEVFPLYGAIDIRNSSTERSKSIQQDILDQLSLARNVVHKAQEHLSFPLLQEIEFQLDKHIAEAERGLQSDEELIIRDFMQHQVAQAFQHLHSTEPSLRNEIEEYNAAIDPQLGMIYHHRREYEKSLSAINDTLAKFTDKEQVAAQKVYPHFFERYVTDGLEFNIFIGQSITPRKKFDEIYLHNLRMWQLTLLAKAARLTHQLEAALSHPLRTTQLILAHSEPLSILFRTEERKFDVDGAYNIRYEIVKKRIDKAHIKNSEERLTQPGKIAIVYSKGKDAAEYSEYIEFLQNKQLLKPGIEHLELEELQGVSGMKALRVDVNFDD
jgi:hypothetical protein